MHHEDDRALPADGVEEDLRDGLAGRRADRVLEVLDGEQEAEDEEPAEDGADADSGNDTQGAGHSRVMRFLCHLSICEYLIPACIENTYMSTGIVAC